MALHAVENVEEAFGVTREFLTPINIRRWLKLALVVFFVGSGVSSRRHSSTRRRHRETFRTVSSRSASRST